METSILYGEKISTEYRNKILFRSDLFFSKTGRRPHLCVIVVGNKAESLSYVQTKKKACQKCNIAYTDIFLPFDVSENKLFDLISELNSDKNTDGILVQLPLPNRENEIKVINTINPSKDVDGFTFVNSGRLLFSQTDDNSLLPCTPKGILFLLDYYNIETRSKKICIIGRSNIVGKPLAAMLMQKGRDATITVCNSFTKDIDSEISCSDIIISAVGIPKFINGDKIKKGSIIIDVGITRVVNKEVKKGYKLCGDVDFDSCLGLAKAITPVPGGVGPLTVTMLLENTLIASCLNTGIDYCNLTDRENHSELSIR